MFNELPAELNLHIFSFLNAESLSKVSLVSKTAKEFADDEQLWLKLLGLRKDDLPENWSAKEIYKIYSPLFKLTENNFSRLIKNKFTHLEGLNNSLMQCAPSSNEGLHGLSVDYINPDCSTSPQMVLCPLSFPLHRERKLRHLYPIKEKMKKKEINYHDLKKEYGLLTIYNYQSFSSSKLKNINCIVIFSLDQSTKNLREIFDYILKCSTENKQSAPLIILALLPIQHRPYHELDEDEKKIILQGFETFINYTGSGDITISYLKERNLLDGLIEKYLSNMHAFYIEETIDQMNLPIISVIRESTEISMLWPKLKNVFDKIEHAASLLNTIQHECEQSKNSLGLTLNK